MTTFLNRKRGFLAILFCAACSFAQAQSATPAAPAPAHDFARWEKDVAAFEASDRTAPPRLRTAGRRARVCIRRRRPSPRTLRTPVTFALDPEVESGPSFANVEGIEGRRVVRTTRPYAAQHARLRMPVSAVVRTCP